MMPTDHEPKDARVQLGSRMRLRDIHGEEEYVLVPRPAADPLQGRLSEESPVGRAVLGRRRGEQIEVTTPDGIRCLTIVDVTPGGASWNGRGATTWAP